MAVALELLHDQTLHRGAGFIPTGASALKGLTVFGRPSQRKAQLPEGWHRIPRGQVAVVTTFILCASTCIDDYVLE